MSRRIVGLAKAADIETLEPSIREGAARGILRLSRHLASQSYTNTDIENFVSLAETVLRDNSPVDQRMVDELAPVIGIQADQRERQPRLDDRHRFDHPPVGTIF